MHCTKSGLWTPSLSSFSALVKFTFYIHIGRVCIYIVSFYNALPNSFLMFNVPSWSLDIEQKEKGQEKDFKKLSTGTYRKYVFTDVMSNLTKTINKDDG